MSLTIKQRLFVEYYLQTFNATEAAKMAGYDAKDYFTFASIGSENLKKPKIQEKIAERMQEAAMLADEVLLRLAQQARANLGDFITIPDTDVPDSEADGDEEAAEQHTQGFYIDLQKAQEAGLLHLVKSIQHTKYGIKLELHDPQRALELIGKHHGLFIDKHEHSGPDGEPLIDFDKALQRIYGNT